MARHSFATVLKILAGFLPAFLFLSAFGGCQISRSPVGRQNVIEGYHEVLLSGGPHSGLFITSDLILNYDYQIKDGKLNISGTSELKHKNVEKLSMTLYYFDEDGTVIDYYRFFGRTRKALIDNTFSRQFECFPEAKAFSIGYTGQTRKGET